MASNKKSVALLAEELAMPILENLGYEFVDSEYVKEGNSWILRYYISKEGGITIDDCEEFSNRIGEVLDENDPIEGSYFLEVSSPGIERKLKKDRDFIREAGKLVLIKLYKPMDGKKEYEGYLVGLIDNQIIIKDENDKEIKFAKADVAMTRLLYQFK